MRSPSPLPSPSQPGRNLLASPEAKPRDPPPSQRWHTPSTSVSQPRKASRPARSPSTSTAGSPSLPAQQTSPSRSASGLGRSRLRGRSPSRPSVFVHKCMAGHSCDLPDGQPQLCYFVVTFKHPEKLRILNNFASNVLHVLSTMLYGAIQVAIRGLGWPGEGGETSGCATLWGCSMVHRGKNIANGSQKSPMSPRNVRAVHKRPPLTPPALKPAGGAYALLSPPHCQLCGPRPHN